MSTDSIQAGSSMIPSSRSRTTSALLRGWSGRRRVASDPRRSLRVLPVATEFELDDHGGRSLRCACRPRPGRRDVGARRSIAIAVPSPAGEVSKALYRAMYQHSLIVAGYTHWVAAHRRAGRTAPRALVTAFCSRHIGPSRRYLGSETAPVLLDLYAQMRHFALVDHRGGLVLLGGARHRPPRRRTGPGRIDATSSCPSGVA